VIIKPLHPKLANTFSYRLRLSASVHSHTWPVIATIMKRALLSSSSPMPRSTADENSNHNHFIIKDSFTVQLTFSDGNCSSSIYLLAFHLLCFVSSLKRKCGFMLKSDIKNFPSMTDPFFQARCATVCKCIYDFWINISKIHTGIWKWNLHARVEVHTLHGYRPLPEKIYNVEMQLWPSFYRVKPFQLKKARISKSGFKKPNWQPCVSAHGPVSALKIPLDTSL